MRIVVNHLTRMAPGFVCVAGVDLKSGRHVRPQPPGRRLGVELLAPNGGPFDMAAEVDIGRPRPQPCLPEVEDCVINPARLKAIRQVPADEFWNLLAGVAKERLTDIFGRDLQEYPAQAGGTWRLDPGCGVASLGCLTPQEPPLLEVNEEQYRDTRRLRVRLRLRDLDGEGLPAVTDFRLYRADQKTPQSELIANLNRRMAGGVAVILSVGVTRAMRGRDHWFQVNNLHLRDDPTWALRAMTADPPTRRRRGWRSLWPFGR